MLCWGAQILLLIGLCYQVLRAKLWSVAAPEVVTKDNFREPVAKIPTKWRHFGVWDLWVIHSLSYISEPNSTGTVSGTRWEFVSEREHHWLSFVVSMNMLLNKQSNCRWFETPCDVTTMYAHTPDVIYPPPCSRLRTVYAAHSRYLAVTFPQ